uniref:Uncharacterized protein n=1 Tax=Physcomitrium patens TaxID=3218 RepID=A0A2K1IMN3_PHYPA|nr:hypothetical protein PHYPA_026850 [Physcomitrium patens]
MLVRWSVFVSVCVCVCIVVLPSPSPPPPERPGLRLIMPAFTGPPTPALLC